MEVGPKNAVLVIKKAEKSDEGPYKLQLENENGSATVDTKVKVLSEYHFSVFIFNAKYDTAEHNQVYTFRWISCWYR